MYCLADSPYLFWDLCSIPGRSCREKFWHPESTCQVYAQHHASGLLLLVFSWQYAAELYNRSYIKRLDDTPYSLVHDRKPDVSLLRRFGSTVYAAFPHPLIAGKIGSRATKGPFLGFDKGDRGYSILNTETL